MDSLVHRVAARFAKVFPTQDALHTYLKDHPNADKSKHKVDDRDEDTKRLDKELGDYRKTEKSREKSEKGKAKRREDKDTARLQKELDDYRELEKKREKAREEAGPREKDAMTAERIAVRFQREVTATQSLTALDEGLDVDLGHTVLADFTMQREHYLPPEAREQKPMEPEGTDLQIWTWESDVRGAKRPFGIAFAGKANKPLWHYAFGSEGSRSEEIKKTIEHRKQYLEAKAKQKEEKANFEHGLQPGAILVCSWGYDQTNIDFYQVIAVKGKNVIIREIGKKVEGPHGGPQERVVPDPEHIEGPPMTKRPTGSPGKPSVKVHSFAWAHPWDGKPEYQTGGSYGH